MSTTISTRQGPTLDAGLFQERYTYAPEPLSDITNLGQLASSSCRGKVRVPVSLATGIISLGDKVVHTPVKVASAITTLHWDDTCPCVVQLSIKATKDTSCCFGDQRYTLHILSMFMQGEYEEQGSAIVGRLMRDVALLADMAGFDRFVVHVGNCVHQAMLRRCLSSLKGFAEVYDGAFERGIASARVAQSQGAAAEASVGPFR